MSAWERSRFSERMSIGLMALLPWTFLASCSTIGINHVASRTETGPTSFFGNQQAGTIPKEAVGLQQKDLEDIDALLRQLGRVGPAEEQAAALLLKEARASLARRQWGPTV